MRGTYLHWMPEWGTVNITIWAVSQIPTPLYAKTIQYNLSSTVLLVYNKLIYLTFIKSLNDAGWQASVKLQLLN